MKTFRVYSEVGEISKPFRSREKAEAVAEKMRQECSESCGTDGMDENNNGNFACGVLSPHGIHIQVLEDGNDVTSVDYGF